MTDEIPSDQTTTIEISGDNDEKQQDFITPKPEKEIPTKTGTKSAQQLAAERKQREAERALRDTERAKKRMSMRTKIAEQKHKASDPLLRLYQFAYESMTNLDSINPTQIKEEWDSVVESFSNARALKTINCAPDSMETLLTAMSQILSKSQRKGGDENVGQIEDETMNKKKLSEENETINDTLAPLTVSDHDAVSKEEIVSPVHKRPKDDKSKFDRSRNAEIVPNSDDTKSNEPEDTNTDSDDNALGQKLYKLCAEDQVDEAIMLILRYKLKDDNHSALAICKCEVFKYAIERVYPRFMGSDIDSDSDEDEPDSDSDEDEPGKCVDGKDIVHPEKPEINQHDEYQHSMRRLFLFKMLLKEGASIYGLLEGEFPRDETVWGTYWKSIAECKDGDAVDLLFQCGVGIHDVNHKEGTKDGNHKFKEYTAWTPIQEAILQRNVPLMKHLLKAGAKSNGYFMKFFKHRDWRLPLTALCPTAICAFWTVTWQYLESKRDDNGFQILKCFLKHCDPKVNGFPNVNHYTFIRDRVLKEKPPSPPPKEENVHVPMSVVDGVSVTSSGLRPQPYQCRLSPGDRYRLEQIRKDPFEKVYRLRTLLHIAVEQCNIEMVKILLIYGADTSLRQIDVSYNKLPPFLQWIRILYRDDDSPEERSSIHFLLQSFVDQALESADIRGESLDVYTILERAECEDQNVKKEIAAFLSSKRGNWFPELLDLYPGDQGKALRFMFREWNTPLPLEVIEEIAQFYYSVTHLLEMKEDDVDITAMIRNIGETLGIR